MRLNRPSPLVRMFFGVALLSSIGFGGLLLAMIVGIDLGRPDLVPLIVGVDTISMVVIACIFQKGIFQETDR